MNRETRANRAAAYSVAFLGIWAFFTVCNALGVALIYSFSLRSTLLLTVFMSWLPALVLTIAYRSYRKTGENPVTAKRGAALSSSMGDEP